VDLLPGTGSSIAWLRDARIVGIDLSTENVVIVARAPVGGEDSAGGRPRTLLKAAKILRQRLRTASGGAFVGLREGDKAAANETAVLLGEFNMAVGVGTWHPLPEEIPAAYAEAREAAEVAIRTGIRHRAVAYDDVLIDHGLRSSEHASRVVTSALGPLRDYDERRGAGLVETLRAYVDTNFSIAGAARALAVHNNTILYRLGRIRELTGRDPRNVDDVIFLALSLRLDAEV
jgi:sugar diacid utilization regulator